MPNYLNPEGNIRIPVQLEESEFNEFILEHLPARTRGPLYKVSRYKIFNYILKFLYMGCQWKMLPIDKDETGWPEILHPLPFLKERGLPSRTAESRRF